MSERPLTQRERNERAERLAMNVLQGEWSESRADAVALALAVLDLLRQHDSRTPEPRGKL